jgi:lipopolysaccharide transport system permease protein
MSSPETTVVNPKASSEDTSSNVPSAAPASAQDVGAERQDWDLVVRPKAGWFDWRLGELWSHRDLLWMFVWRDFVTVHKQTILGPLWHVINPILTALMYSLIFGRMVRLSTNGLPPILFYMGGTVAWNYFLACFYKTNNSLAGNAGLFGKVYFHRLVVPLSVVISSFISFAIQCGIFAVMIGIFTLRGAAIHPNLWLLSLPLLVGMLAGYGLALGLICSALTTRYRDLGQLVGFITQLMMYATPVIYPISYVSERYRWIIHCNPLAAIIETFRYACLGKGEPEALLLGSSALVLFALLILGVTIFTRAERTFLDTV